MALGSGGGWVKAFSAVGSSEGFILHLKRIVSWRQTCSDLELYSICFFGRLIDMGLLDVSNQLPQSTLFYVAAGVAAVLLLLQRVTAVNKHSSEPPFVPTRVPFFGHLFGVLFEQTSYYARMR
jgi:hypothetical protein